MNSIELDQSYIEMKGADLTLDARDGIASGMNTRITEREFLRDILPQQNKIL